MLMQKVLRPPHELSIRPRHRLAAIQEFAESHCPAGQVEAAVDRLVNRKHQKSGHIFHVHHFDGITAVARTDVATPALRTDQPGKQIRSAIAISLDWPWPHDG